MLKRTSAVLWHPAYFKKRVPTKIANTSRTSTHASSTKVGTSTEKKRVHPQLLDSSAYMTAADVVVLRGVRDSVEAAKSYLEVLTSGRNGRRLSSTENARVVFDAKQRVFAVLHGLLPTPPPAPVPASAATVSIHVPPASLTLTDSRAPQPPRKLRVIPDEYVNDPAAYTRQIANPGETSASSSISSSTTASNASLLSLEDIVVLLELYDAVEHEDGKLLLQILAQLDRFLSVTIPAGKSRIHDRGNKGPGAPLVKLPLAQLMYSVSRLGVIPEHTLHTLTDCPSRQERRPALFPAQLRLCDENELLTLLVALHRFGLHEHRSTELVLRQLQRYLHQPGSAAFHFSKASQRIERGLTQSSSESTGPEPDSAIKQLKGLAKTLDESLQCSLPLLVEANTALARTVFRRDDVVQLVSSLIAVSALRDGRAIRKAMRHITTSNVAEGTEDKPGDASEAMRVLTRLVLHAVKLTERMELPQPLLAETLEWCCARSGAGVFIDGGEDADVPSDQRAYYDHVTADLVKVGHVM